MKAKAPRPGQTTDAGSAWNPTVYHLPNRAVATRRMTHATFVAAIHQDTTLRPMSLEATKEHKLAIAELGFDDCEARWEDSPVAQEALRRFGALTLDDIGILWGLTRERIRQIQRNAFENLANPANLARSIRGDMRRLLAEGHAAQERNAPHEELARIYLELDETTERLEALESLSQQAEAIGDAREATWDRMGFYEGTALR